MDEETMKKARGLLDKMPELKTEEEIQWKETGAGETLRLLCELLKRNAIPTKKLKFRCKIYKETKRKENTNEESFEIEQGMVVSVHAILEQKEQR